MRDLAAVDRQLAELASELPAPDVRALLGRILGNDRSLARLNELLEGLGVTAGTGSSPRPPAALLRDPLGGPGQRPSQRAPARPATNNGAAEAQPVPRSDPPPAMRPNPVHPPGVRGSLPPRIVSPLAPVQGDSLKTATPWPPVAAGTAPARSPRDTLVDAAVPPPVLPQPLPQVDEVELDAATRALFGITELPVAGSMAPDAAATAVPADAPIPAEEDAFRSDKRRKTLTFGSGVTPLPPPSELVTNAIPPANMPSPAAVAEARAEAREARQSIRALLDKEIDPRDFPSSHPPRARSMPPPLSKQQPPAAVAPVVVPAGVAPDAFEMLIDDEAEDDIIEIDDVELEEIE
jgi:hypothetical protein